jgi:hypothetical protein
VFDEQNSVTLLDGVLRLNPKLQQELTIIAQNDPSPSAKALSSKTPEISQTPSLTQTSVDLDELISKANGELKLKAGRYKTAGLYNVKNLVISAVDRVSIASPVLIKSSKQLSLKGMITLEQGIVVEDSEAIALEGLSLNGLEQDNTLVLRRSRNIKLQNNNITLTTTPQKPSVWIQGPCESVASSSNQWQGGVTLWAKDGDVSYQGTKDKIWGSPEFGIHAYEGRNTTLKATLTNCELWGNPKGCTATSGLPQLSLIDNLCKEE